MFAAVFVYIRLSMGKDVSTNQAYKSSVLISPTTLLIENRVVEFIGNTALIKDNNNERIYY